MFEATQAQHAIIPTNRNTAVYDVIAENMHAADLPQNRFPPTTTITTTASAAIAGRDDPMHQLLSHTQSRHLPLCSACIYFVYAVHAITKTCHSHRSNCTDRPSVWRATNKISPASPTHMYTGSLASTSCPHTLRGNTPPRRRTPTPSEPSSPFGLLAPHTYTNY